MDDISVKSQEKNKSMEVNTSKEENKEIEIYEYDHANENIEDVSNELFAGESYEKLKEKKNLVVKKVKKNMPAEYNEEEHKSEGGHVDPAYMAARIPEELADLLNDIIAWERGKTHKKTSQPLIAAAKQMIRLRDEYEDYEPDEAVEILGRVMKTAIFYLKENAGYRFFKSGDRRKDTVRSLIRAVEDYAVGAGADYVEAYGNRLLRFDIGDSKSLAEMRRNFRFRYTFDTNAENFDEHIEILRKREDDGEEHLNLEDLAVIDYYREEARLSKGYEEDILKEFEVKHEGEIEDDPEVKELDREIAEIQQKILEARLSAEEKARLAAERKRQAERDRDIAEFKAMLKESRHMETRSNVVQRQILQREIALKKDEILEKRRSIIENASSAYRKLDQKKVTDAELAVAKTGIISAICRLSEFDADRFTMLPADMLHNLLSSMMSDIEDKKRMKDNLLVALDEARASLTSDNLPGIIELHESRGEKALMREYAVYDYSRNTVVFKEDRKAFNHEDLKGISTEDLRDLSENALALSKIYTKEGADVETLREAAVYTLAQKTGRQASDFENLPYSMLFEMAKQALVSDIDKTKAQLEEKYIRQRDEFVGGDHTEEIRTLAREVQCGNKEDTAALRELCIFELTKDSTIKRTDLTDLSALTLYNLFEDNLSHREEKKDDAKTNKLLNDLDAERRIKLAEEKDYTSKKNDIEKQLKEEVDKLEYLYQIFADGKYIEKGKIKNKFFGPSESAIKEERQKTDEAIKKLEGEKVVTVTESEKVLKGGKEVNVAKTISLSYIEGINYYNQKAKEAKTSAGKLARRIKEQKDLSAMEKELDKTWLKDRLAEEHVRQTSREEYDPKQYESRIWIKAKDDVEPWSDDAAGALDLIGELVSGDQVYDSRGKAVAEDKKLQTILSNHLPLLLKMVEGRKAEVPGQPGWGGPLGEVQRRVSDDQRALLSTIKETFLDKVLDKITEYSGDRKLDRKTLSDILASEDMSSFLNAYEGVLAGAIDAGDKMVQKQLDTATEIMFGGVGLEMKDFFELHDYKYNKETQALEPLTKKEIEEKRKEEAETEKTEKLAKIRDMVFDTKKGQGRFLDQVFKGYYRNAADSERRYMMSYVIKDMKPKRLHETARQRGGAYFASMLKGAGPLMQKLFQGVPEQMLPKEFKGALSVVKSDLRPIPDAYVNRKLRQIARASSENVESITKVKSLGAASIAETYLCNVTYKDGNTEQVVLKLLRPDVKSRMEKEKKFILDCAKKTDENGVMEGSFNAHLTKIYEELNFKNEASNIEKGSVYQKPQKGLGSVKLNKNIPAGEDYLVMNKADGVTLDRYIEENKSFGSKILNKYRNSDVTSDYAYAIDRYNIEEYYKDRRALEKRLQEAENRYSHIETLVAQWIEEALFESRFRHGDLHAGNIMIDKKQATVLDYGNATKLEGKKVDAIVKMMAAAFFGNTQNYIAGLEDLLALDKGNNYKNLEKEEKDGIKAKLEKELTEIFSLGSRARTGEKIFVSLLKCQELGIKLPREVQNFSQCEQRLENTINEFGNVVSSLRSALYTMDKIQIVTNADVCMEPMAILQQKIGITGTKFTVAEEARQLVVEYSDPTEEEVKKDLKSLDRDDFEDKYLAEYINLRDAYNDNKEIFETIAGNAQKYRDALKVVMQFKGMSYDEIKKSGRFKEFDDNFNISGEINFLLISLPEDTFAMFGGTRYVAGLFSEAFGGNDESKLEAGIDIFQRQIPKIISFMEKYEKMRTIKKEEARAKAEEEFVKNLIDQKNSGVMDKETTVEMMEGISPDLINRSYVPMPYKQTLSRIQRDKKGYYWQTDEKGECKNGIYGLEMKASFETCLDYESRKDKLTEEEKAEFKKAKEKLCRDFCFANTVHMNLDLYNDMFEKQNAIYFDDKVDGAALRAAFEERKRLQKIYIRKRYDNAEDLEEVEKQRKQAERDFTLIYRRIVKKHAEIRAKYYRGSKNHNHHLKNFIWVMQEVLQNHEFALGKILGIKQSIKYKKQM